MIERVLVASVPAALVVALAWSAGGYYPRTWGAVLLVEAIAILSFSILATSVETSLAARLVVGALLGLAAWQLLSGRWAIDPDATVLEAERTLVYAGAAASAFLIVSRDRAQALVLGVLAGTGIVTVGGLLEHVLRTEASGDRLELPVGYANASGILAAVALLLGLGLAGDERRPRRCLGAALAPPAAAALYLSLSRGSVLAAAVGLVLLLVTARWRSLGPSGSRCSSSRCSPRSAERGGRPASLPERRHSPHTSHFSSTRCSTGTGSCPP